jgi:hypothetical protein
MNVCLRISAFLAVLLGATSVAGTEAGLAVQFNRDIRPILSDNCFACHGFDANTREAGLRLDTAEGAVTELRGGRFAIVPGAPEKSELYQRITAPDPLEVMPPPETGKSLNPEQVSLLKRWIEQGAAYEEHWAFAPVQRPVLPEVKLASWPRNPIDHFVLSVLENEKLKPSPEASRETLIRRASLTLTGLPPAPEEVDAFLADNSPGAYEKMIDHLLESSRYGEHMARYWLDAARYGDTHGLHLDNERSIWPYRDWVIEAFNKNKPFDQFTIEQLAGDLLPEPSLDQLIATGFNRCNVSTSEGGAIPEEFAARYAVDRVETVSTVWMGLTAACASCHDHKYDPLTKKEFYQLYAFFNNLDENPMDGNALLHPPVVRVAAPEEERQLAEFDGKINALQNFVRAGLASVDYTEPLDASEAQELPRKEFVWIEDDLPEEAKASTGSEAWVFVSGPESPVFSGERATVRNATRFGQHFFTEARDRLLIGKDDLLFAHVHLDPENPPRAIMLQFNDGNWEHRVYWGDDLFEFGTNNSPSRRHGGALPEAGKWVRLEVKASEVGLQPGARVNGWAFSQYGGRVYWDKAGIVSALPQGGAGFDSQLVWEQFIREARRTDGVPEEVVKAVRAEERTEEQATLIANHFLEHVHPPTRSLIAPLHEKLAGLRKERDDLDRTIPRTLVTRELPEPRPTHILVRGDYATKGDEVTAEVPNVFPPMALELPRNRLGLAKWLVDPQHPLTARVTINRIWQQHFGFGLAKTAEDFGSQGEPPSHPELLDWLASEFVQSGWDLKQMHRLILSSATYRQSSDFTPDLVARDPENRLLARGPNFRLDGEAIRDSILAISGLLVEKIGGRGVRPYQPEGIWEAVAYTTSNTARYQKDEGEALYRRSLYLFWKRTAPPPTLTTFDAPSRESCRVRRERTNTPLQALALMNDVPYIEAARRLAERMIKEGGSSPQERVAYGFRLATARFPDGQETRILNDLYHSQLAEFQSNGSAASELLSVGDSPYDESLDAHELAAWTMVANTLLNLSETITKN